MARSKISKKGLGPVDNVETIVYSISEERRTVQNYYEYCGSRKSDMFKLSVTIFSILAAATAAMSAPVLKETSLSAASINLFGFLFVISLLSSMLNMSLLFQYGSAHIGAILSMQQGNLLRRSHAALMYYLVEGKHPSTKADLENIKTKYWRLLGNDRTAPIDNTRLIDDQDGSRFYLSSAGITMLVMVFMMAVPPYLIVAVYTLSKGSIGLALAVGALSIVLPLAGIFIIHNVKNRLQRELHRREQERNNIP